VSSAGKTKLQAVTPAALSTDEQALLAAYRVMDDEGRADTLKMANCQAENYPAPAPRGRRLTIMVATCADEQAILRDYRAMDADARSDFCCISTAFATDRPARAPRVPLRLVIGGRS